MGGSPTMRGAERVNAGDRSPMGMREDMAVPAPSSLRPRETGRRIGLSPGELRERRQFRDEQAELKRRVSDLSAIRCVRIFFSSVWGASNRSHRVPAAR